MSNDIQLVNHGTKHVGVGVSKYHVPKEIFEPSKERSAPLRSGSMDAFKKPSLDHTGKRKPYWGNVEC